MDDFRLDDFLMFCVGGVAIIAGIVAFGLLTYATHGIFAALFVPGALYYLWSIKK